MLAFKGRSQQHQLNMGFLLLHEFDVGIAQIRGRSGERWRRGGGGLGLTRPPSSEVVVQVVKTCESPWRRRRGAGSFPVRHFFLHAAGVCTTFFYPKNLVTRFVAAPFHCRNAYHATIT